jgi:hypothetical protein
MDPDITVPMRPDSNRVKRFGANPKGVQLPDKDTKTAAFLLCSANPGLPIIQSTNPSTAMREDANALVAGIMSYYDTYTVDEAP